MEGQFSKARLVGYRHARRETQRAVGEFVDRRPLTVQGWESGDRTPTPDTIDSLCRFFDIARGSLNTRYEDPCADYLDAIADATGTPLTREAATAAAAVLAHVGRVRGRPAGVGAT